MNYCIMCNKQIYGTIVKPYKSRGRFPSKSGAVCVKCLQKIQSYLMPKTKEELVKLIDKMKKDGEI